MRFVYCRFNLVGFHSWPAAPKGLLYLANNHRHEFHFEVSVEVNHDNREIEFITLKEQCLVFAKKLWEVDSKGNCMFFARSCEMIADELLRELKHISPYDKMPPISVGTTGRSRHITVDVSEDGENGAHVSNF